MRASVPFLRRVMRHVEESKLTWHTLEDFGAAEWSLSRMMTFGKKDYIVRYWPDAGGDRLTVGLFHPGAELEETVYRSYVMPGSNKELIELVQEIHNGTD